jgi:hypothetical protein
VQRRHEAPPTMTDAHAELKRLLGRWKATPYRVEMELEFQVG